MDWKRKHCINQLAVGFGPGSYGPQWNFELVVEVCSFQLPYFTQQTQNVQAAPHIYHIYSNLTLQHNVSAGIQSFVLCHE